MTEMLHIFETRSTGHWLMKWNAGPNLESLKEERNLFAIRDGAKGVFAAAGQMAGGQFVMGPTRYVFNPRINTWTEAGREAA